jgi:hypothetical protein
MRRRPRTVAPSADDATSAGATDPARTMLEVQRLFDDDIVEIDSIFYAPRNK